MTKHFTRQWSLALLTALVSSVAVAKLPPPSPESAAKAAEAAAKAAWAGKVDGFLLCRAQDRVAAHYLRTVPSATPGMATGAACTDPGPFAYTPPADKPLEAAGAHSPTGTASSPPSTATPAAATGSAEPKR